MTSPSRRALLARALAFRGLPNQLVDPRSTQLVKLVTALTVGGLLVSALLNLLAEPRPVFLAAPILAMLFLSLELFSDRFDPRTRLTLLATLIAVLGLTPAFRFESVFAAAAPFSIAAFLLAMAWGTRSAVIAQWMLISGTFLTLHPWGQSSDPAEALVAWFQVMAWSAALLMVCGLLLDIWASRLGRAESARRRLTHKLSAMQKVMSDTMTRPSPATGQNLQLPEGAMKRMLSDNRLRLAAMGHFSPNSPERVDLFTWQRLLGLVKDALQASPETRGVQLHIFDTTARQDAVLADAGRIAAVLYGFANFASTARKASNLWLTLKSEAISEGRARFTLRLEHDGFIASDDGMQQLLTNPKARKSLRTTDEAQLVWLGQWLQELGAVPLFGMGKFGVKAVGFNVSAETVTLGVAKSTNAQPVVLVVDDDAMQRISLKRMIEDSFGARVLGVATANEALRCIEEVAVDLVVTDFYMPEVDGAELTRALRQMECNVPVVAITVANSAEQQEPLWQSGVDLVLSKPVSTQALTSAMQRFMAA